MPDKGPQSYKTHRKYVPLFHFLLSSILLLNFLWRLWRLLEPSTERVAEALLAFALLLVFYYIREFPLRVQDRLIRLEETLRLREVLPPEHHDRIGHITPKQLIGLRFAADKELDELTERIVAGELVGREQIKKAVRNWRPDHQRC